VAALGAVAIAATASVRSSIYSALATRPWAWPFVLLAVAGLVSAFWFRLRGRYVAAFLGSCAFLGGTLAATAAGLFPVILPSSFDPAYSVTAFTAAAGEHGLRVGLVWWSIGIALAAAYTIHVYRTMVLKGKAPEDHGGSSTG
jgi:cytochrome d ubiquinol oxidase subunit II